MLQTKANLTLLDSLETDHDLFFKVTVFPVLLGTVPGPGLHCGKSPVLVLVLQSLPIATTLVFPFLCYISNTNRYMSVAGSCL